MFMIRTASSLIIPAILLLLTLSCRPPADNQGSMEATDTVRVDETFTGLFNRTGEGFTGGDGTYSVELPDGRTLWIFGDTFIGGVNSDGTRQHQEPKFVRNSAVVMDGDSLTTLYRQLDGLNASLVIHPSVLAGRDGLTEDSVWFWPGDGFVEGNQLKLFLSEFAQRDTGMWGFEWLGTWIASFSLPSLEQQKLVKILTEDETSIHYGHAVLTEDPYVYVYGLGNGKIHVARYRTGKEEGPWEYFTGGDWTGNIARAAPISSFDGSEQFSVFRYDGHYVLVTQLGGFSHEICSFLSDTPYGPWGSKRLLYAIPHPDPELQLITYNALAHPDLSEKGMLLISYNVNSLVLEDHYRHAWIYRPRFIRIPMGMILGTVPPKSTP
jgi:hypothetical protein